MVVLLECDDPGDIVECHGAQTEIGIIGDLVDLLDERIKVRSCDAIDGRDKIGGRQIVLVSRRTPALYYAQVSISAKSVD